MTTAWGPATSGWDVPPDIPRGIRSAPIVGHRAWRIRFDAPAGPSWEPILSSLTASADWPTADLMASCDRRLGRRRHEVGTRVPVLDCSCGIYAGRSPSAVTGSGHPVVATGPVRLSGRVIEGRRGYRAERARITGPLVVSLGCAHARCAEIPVFAVRGAGAVRPVCLPHLVAEPKVERVVTLEHFAQAVCARLELRYGVEARTSALEEVVRWT
jgi:hypothetical protein